MSTKSLLTGLSLLVALSITGCDNNKTTAPELANSSTNTIVIDHAQGSTDVPIDPKKVVVFNIATLDTMDALGIEVIAVPQTSVHLPLFLAKYEDDNYQNVGTLFEPNYEELSNLQPDLILAGGRTNDAYDKLSEIAPTVSLNIENVGFIDSLTLRTEQLGQIFGKEEQAAVLLNEFKQKMSDVKAQSIHHGTAMVIMINGGKMSAYGPGSRFGFIFDELGFNPAVSFPEGGRHGNVINSELLLSANPDWLFILDRDSAIGNKEAQSAFQVLDNPLVRKTNAWNKDQIVYLDSSSMYIAGGLQSYSHLLDQIQQVLTDHQQ